MSIPFAQRIIEALPVKLVVTLIATGIVSLLIWASRWTSKSWRRRHFKKVFGFNTSKCYLAFGSLAVHPVLIDLARRYLTSPNDPNLAHFPLTKPSRPKWFFSAQQVSNVCEIRAVAYVVSAFREVSGLAYEIVTDELIQKRLDVDFVSFGAMSNLKTRDALTNPANTLVEYDEEMKSFVSKSNATPLHPLRAGYDYGIILKIHPAQFQSRTWICCAGIGEWGTSGTAYFLANKWHEIARQINADESFVCTIEVEIERGDESAQIHSLKTAPQPRH